ncbi:hypothetical protein SAMN05443665_10237 [Actinomadura meyerae]|uniref:Uncharacterized protein n=1 Tax=Actinomadura meyerae TaxID=240840 RepID=A0A239LLS0_9ACTN|nr:hypothetical protein SAMN05443665_10237 [Actinomadura meyerae]
MPLEGEGTITAEGMPASAWSTGAVGHRARLDGLRVEGCEAVREQAAEYGRQARAFVSGAVDGAGAETP